MFNVSILLADCSVYTTILGVPHFELPSLLDEVNARGLGQFGYVIEPA